jgi:hypothetical protein
MQTVVLEVEPEALEDLRAFIAHYPKNKIAIKADPIAQELAERIHRIDSGEESLTPLKEGMDKVRQKLKRCHASQTNSAFSG